MLSHPIAILWPFWVLYYARQVGSERRRLWTLGALSLPLAALALLWSFRYYSGLYVAHTLNFKFASSPEAGPSISLLAHGRYLFNLVAPLKLAAVYYPGSVWNMAGLFAAPFVFAGLLVGRRGKESSESWGWLAFYFFPLLPVTLVMTNVFVSDTYALLPAFGLTVLAARLLDGLELDRAWVSAAFAAAFVSLTLLARAQAGAWSSDRELWVRADDVESSPRSLAMRARVSLGNGDAISAREFLARLREWDPQNADYPSLFARAIYLDPRLTGAEKADLLSREDQPGSLAHADPWFNYFYGATLAAAGNFREADERYQVVTRNPEAFEDELGKAAAEALEICRRSAAADCAARAVELRRRIAGSAVLLSHWDEAAFRSRASELDRSLAGGK